MEKWSPVVVTHTFLLGRSEDGIVDRPTGAARTATGDPRDEYFVIRIENDNRVDCAPESPQHHVERRGLPLGSRKAVEDHAGPGGQGVQLFLYHFDDEMIGYEITSGHVLLSLVPQGGALILRGTQKIARDHSLPSHRVRKQYSLRALTDAGRAQ